MSFYDQFVGWVAEASWGASPVARTAFSRFNKGTFLRHQRPQEPATQVGFRDVQRHVKQLEFGEGKLMLPLAYGGALQTLWEHAFGAVSGAGTVASPFLFTLDQNPFTRASSPLSGLLLELHAALPDSGFESFLMRGARFTEWGCEFSPEEPVVFDGDVSGRNVEEGAKTASPTYPDLETDEVIAEQITVEIDDTVTAVNGCSFRVNNNLNTSRGKLDGTPYVTAALAAPGRRIVSGTISKDWDNRTLYGKFLSGATAKLEIICTGPNPKVMKFELPQLKLTGETPEADEGEYQEQNLPFTAEDDGSNGPLTLTDTQTA